MISAYIVVGITFRYTANADVPCCVTYGIVLALTVLWAGVASFRFKTEPISTFACASAIHARQIIYAITAGAAASIIPAFLSVAVASATLTFIARLSILALAVFWTSGAVFTIQLLAQSISTSFVVAGAHPVLVAGVVDRLLIAVVAGCSNFLVVFEALTADASCVDACFQFTEIIDTLNTS